MCSYGWLFDSIYNILPLKNCEMSSKIILTLFIVKIMSSFGNGIAFIFQLQIYLISQILKD